MKRLLNLLVAVVFIAGLAACGDDGSGPATTGSPATTSPETTTTMPPVDPNQRILLVRREGGLMPPEALYARLPLYVLYADGRLLYQGAQPAIYPGPLLPSVVQVQIGVEGMARVLEAVLAVGLPDVEELYNTDAIGQVADGPNTEVTYFDENGDHFFSVYALEIAEQTDPQAMKLKDLVHLLDELAASSPDAGTFTIDRLQVVATPGAPDPSNPDVVVDPWPMKIEPADMQDEGMLLCTAFDVAADPDALAAFTAAHQLTLFEFGDSTYRLTVRPLLVGETACAPRTR